MRSLMPMAATDRNGCMQQDGACRRRPAAWRFALWLGLAVLLCAADQFTKMVMLHYLRPGEVVPVTGFFNLVLVGNYGSAFSFLGNAGGWQIYLFSILALVAVVVIVWLLWRHNHRLFLSLALALVAAGAVGNLWDRVTLAFVIDFLDFHLGGLHWPAFNLADVWICTGAAGIVIDEFRKGRKPKENASADQSAG